MCLWKIPSLGRSACLSKASARDTKTPQRWAVTICPLQGLRISSGRSQSFLSQADVCADLFTCFLFPWQIALIRRQVPANRKRAPHPGVIPVTFRNGASLTGKAVEPLLCAGVLALSWERSLPPFSHSWRRRTGCGEQASARGHWKGASGEAARLRGSEAASRLADTCPPRRRGPSPLREAGLLAFPPFLPPAGSHQHNPAVVPGHDRRHCFVLNQSLK